jgi:hypothetical protein
MLVLPKLQDYYLLLDKTFSLSVFVFWLIETLQYIQKLLGGGVSYRVVSKLKNCSLSTAIFSAISNPNELIDKIRGE